MWICEKTLLNNEASNPRFFSFLITQEFLHIATNTGVLNQSIVALKNEADEKFKGLFDTGLIDETFRTSDIWIIIKNLSTNLAELDCYLKWDT